MRASRAVGCGWRSIWPACLAVIASGCGSFSAPTTAPLFTMPLTVEGTPAGSAILDTGGGYDVMLADNFGLKIASTTEVLVFNGRERVGLTEDFALSLGGHSARADSALVGLSLCDCNGIGFFFFRKTGLILGLDFPKQSADLTSVLPVGGVSLPFAQTPAGLSSFDSSFIEVDLRVDRRTRRIVGLLDTGSNISVLRRNLAKATSLLNPDRATISVFHEALGNVTVQALLFDTPGLPDLIIGTDAMGIWSDRWYFQFDPVGGTITVFPRNQTAPLANATTGPPLPSTGSPLLRQGISPMVDLNRVDLSR